MKTSGSNRLLLATSGIGLLLTQPSPADLVGYWPINETTGPLTANAVGGGSDGILNGNVFFLDDFERGNVLQFFGGGAYVDAGFLPQQTLTNDFTWSFWAQNETDPVALPNVVIVGNRYSGPSNIDYTPREFTKFTPTKFEFHHDGVNDDTLYNTFPAFSLWTHVSAVKQGNWVTTYQNGLVQTMHRINAGQNNPQPFFFGGNGAFESWTGKLDDVAVWSNALPTSAVVGLATGQHTPLTAPVSDTPPALQTVFSEDFSAGLGNWIPTDRGLENNGFAGYDPQAVVGEQVVLGGLAQSQYWFGSSIESTMRFSSLVETTITVDRVSLNASGTAFRSSLWILGDDAHYLHFSQNIGENGWQFNARDDGGVGTLLPTGSGNNIPELDIFDGSLGTHTMSIQLVPTGIPGSVNMFMYLHGSLVAGRGFSSFPDEFSVVLTGQARAINDTVSATFDNLMVMQVPEPFSAGLVALGAVLGLGWRRRDPRARV